jgi:hypothetical protein
MENLAQSLKELGEKIGFDIALDADGTCTLELADGRPLVIQERANLDELDFVSVVGEVPDALRAEVFTALLSANFYWNGTLGATLSWDPGLEQVVIIYPLPLANATDETLENVLKRFLELQAAWKDRLAELISEAEDEENLADDEASGNNADDDSLNASDMIINP